MPHRYVVTVTAADQVGIVHAVTGTILTRQGNVLELSQTVLRGYFTIILAAEFDEPIETRELEEALTADGSRFGLYAKVIRVLDEHRPPPVPDGERFILTVLGRDQRGIIHGIAGCLAEQGVNIVDLHARSDHGRFMLVMEAFLPPDLPPATVRAGLERFGRDLGLEAYVQHEDIFQATAEPSPVRLGVARRREGGHAGVPH